MKRQIFQFEEFELDAENRSLRRGGENLNLNAKSFDLLRTLLENRGRLVSKDELFASVWRDQVVEESNLTVHISQIRKALGETKRKPRFIETVPGYGYRFVGPVRDMDDEGGGTVIETETLSRITIESETEEEAPEGKESDPPSPVAGTAEPESLAHAGFSARRNTETKRGRLNRLSPALVLSVLLAAALGAYYLKPGTPAGRRFERVKLSRLTNNGKISAAAFSPDGKFIAYVLGETEGNSLWVRQTGAANDTRILPPQKAEFWGLKFTPDGGRLFYSIFSGDRTDVELFQIPALGGVPEKIPGVIAHSITFSPDGERLAFVYPDSKGGQSYLVVADREGTNQKILARKTQPDTFVFGGSFAAWSPDGRTIAVLVNHLEREANYNSIVGVDAETGAERILSPDKWHAVGSLEWLKDGGGLIVAGAIGKKSKNKIWFVPTPADGGVGGGGGGARSLTEDLNDYSWVGTAAHAAGKGDSIVALQSVASSAIFVGEIGSEPRDFKELVSETGALSPLDWTPDGKIVFRSWADGNSNLWLMDADGANRRQLTADAEVDGRGMCVTADGRHVVFVSWRSGKSNLWRVGTDGKDLTRLTDGEADAYPSCPADGNSIVYQRGILSQPALWKISVDGGEPERVTDFYAKWGAVSRDSRRISFFRMSDDKWQIGIFSVDQNALVARLDVPARLRESKTLWSGDDENILFIGGTGSVGNVWKMSVRDGRTEPVTDFRSLYLDDFSVARSGNKIAVARSSQLSDLVLIEKAE